MFVYVVVLNIILNTGVTHLDRAIAVTVMEGVTNMLRLFKEQGDKRSML
jgi:hypothetical protein